MREIVAAGVMGSVSGAIAAGLFMSYLQGRQPAAAKGAAKAAAPAEEEEAPDEELVDVPAPKATRNEGLVADETTPTTVGGDTPPDADWGGLNADMDLSNPDGLPGLEPLPPGDGGDEAVWPLTRDGSSMSLGVGSNGSLSSLLPPSSPRGWGDDAPDLLPLDGPPNHTAKKPRTGSSGLSPRVKVEQAQAVGAAGPLSPAEGMVSAVQHGSIPPEVIAKALPAELAFALLDSDQFEPGKRPAIFNPAEGQWLFKEETVGGKPSKPGGSDPSKADRWHNSGGVKGSRDMPPNAPLVRRRYGAVVQADGSKGFRYHEYTRVHIDPSPGAADAQRTVSEDRSVVLFHVMPKRTEKGRPSRSESEAPAKLWASLGLGLQQQGASVVPQPHGAAANATPPGPGAHADLGGDRPWLRVNPSRQSVESGRAIMAMVGPANPSVRSQYITFQKGTAVLGSLTQSADGRGVCLESGGADVAEWHRICPSQLADAAALSEGEVVGVHPAGLSRKTAGAAVVGVVSHRAIVKGGLPQPSEAAAFETVAYVGRVPIRVRGAVQAGDALTPSGDDDGLAVAAPMGRSARPERRVCAVALSAGARGGEGWAWVEACIVPPAVGSALGLALNSLRSDRYAHAPNPRSLLCGRSVLTPDGRLGRAEMERAGKQRDAEVAQLTTRLARLEAALTQC